GFMMYFAGVVFYAAAIVSIDADTKQKMAVWMQATGQPIPPAMADWLGIKKAASTDKPGAPGATGTAANPGAAPASATPDVTAAPASAATLGLETPEQVLAAVAELNDRAAKLKARKDMLKGSADQVGLAQLAEDIKAFNERLRAVTA